MHLKRRIAGVLDAVRHSRRDEGEIPHGQLPLLLGDAYFVHDPRSARKGEPARRCELRLRWNSAPRRPPATATSTKSSCVGGAAHALRMFSGRAVADVVNAYLHFDLVKAWGDGSTVAAGVCPC